jgi:hypothetical protein
MQKFSYLLVVVLVVVMSLNCQALVITCGEEGTFMFPYDLTIAAGGVFPPCALCDSAAGKWSEAFTPSKDSTDCGCKSGRYFVEGVDRSSFTCPQCPMGTYKDGISRVETCRPLGPGEVHESIESDTKKTETLSSGEIGDSGIDFDVLHHLESKTPITPVLPTWVIALTVSNSIVAFISAMALIVYIKKHVYHTRIDIELEPPMANQLVYVKTNPPV